LRAGPRTPGRAAAAARSHPCQRRRSRAAPVGGTHGPKPWPSTDEAKQAGSQQGERSLGLRVGLRGQHRHSWGAAPQRPGRDGPAAAFMIRAASLGEGQGPRPEPGKQWVRSRKPPAPRGLLQGSAPHQIPFHLQQRAATGSAHRQHGGETGARLSLQRPAPQQAGDPLGRRAGVNGGRGGPGAPARGSTLRPEFRPARPTGGSRATASALRRGVGGEAVAGSSTPPGPGAGGRTSHGFRPEPRAPAGRNRAALPGLPLAITSGMAWVGSVQSSRLRPPLLPPRRTACAQGPAPRAPPAPGLGPAIQPQQRFSVPEKAQQSAVARAQRSFERRRVLLASSTGTPATTLRRRLQRSWRSAVRGWPLSLRRRSSRSLGAAAAMGRPQPVRALAQRAGASPGLPRAGATSRHRARAGARPRHAPRFPRRHQHLPVEHLTGDVI